MLFQTNSEINIEIQAVEHKVVKDFLGKDIVSMAPFPHSPKVNCDLKYFSICFLYITFVHT
jgi:hypothetical protein